VLLPVCRAASTIHGNRFVQSCLFLVNRRTLLPSRVTRKR
jgi:hypothetical protein